MAAPPPQGGTNVLRGGKNMYGTKVLEGNWYNDRKQANEYARPEVVTETQIRGAESELRGAPRAPRPKPPFPSATPGRLTHPAPAAPP
jgi:hypothetical protein